MNPTQIFKFARIWIYSENWKTNSRVTGQKPRSAQLHSGAWPMLGLGQRSARRRRGTLASRWRPHQRTGDGRGKRGAWHDDVDIGVGGTVRTGRRRLQTAAVRTVAREARWAGERLSGGGRRSGRGARGEASERDRGGRDSSGWECF
jgi:hypothetical protein